MDIKEFIAKMPKAELHLHIEGTLEPELLFKLGKRNNIALKFDSVEDLSKAYNFSNLQDFLDIYYQGTNVLQKEEDFFDLTYAYFQKIASQNVRHAEIFFDPQSHTDRGIDFSVVINGIYSAMEQAKSDFDLSSKLIMSFLRHLDEKSAFATLKNGIQHKDKIVAVGLDSSELGHPPSKFERVFKAAENEGFLKVCHAGEEGPPEYVREAIDILGVDRIDHGNRTLENDELTQIVSERKIPLTVCPQSNLKLRVVKDLKEHPLKTMLNKNLVATVNSDDPAYFGGYMNENFNSVSSALNLSSDDLLTLTKNSFIAGFISDELKNKYIAEVDEYFNNNSVNI